MILEVGDSGYRVSRYEIDLDYRAPSNRLRGRVRLSCVAEHELPRFTIDLAGLRATGVRLPAGRGGRFGSRGDRLHVRLRSPLGQGEPFTVDVRYEGKPDRRPGTPLFPRNDRHDDKSTYRIAATVDPGFVLLAGTAAAAGAGAPARRRAHVWTSRHDEPVAIHRALVHIGEYDVLDLPGGHRLAVRGGARPAVRRAVSRQARMAELFERLFGPFPLDSYTVAASDQVLEQPVEGHGLTVFGANHLPGPAAERLLAHALAGQWFGSSLSAATPAECWLTGGMARYAAWLWSAESGSTGLQALAGRARRGLETGRRSGGDREDRLLDQGALAVHALREALGPDEFFALLRSWCRTYRHAAVRVADFRDFVARNATGAPEWPVPDA